MLEMHRCMCGRKSSIRPEIKLGEVWSKTLSREQTTARKGISHLPMYWEQREDQEWGQAWREAELRY